MADGQAADPADSLALTVNGPSVMVSFSAGEEAVLSLEGRKGQRLTLQAESLNVVRFPEDIGFTLRGVPVSIVNAKTKVTVVEHFYWYGNLRAGDGFSFTLPDTGQFNVLVRPNQIFEGDLAFRLKSPKRASLTVNGPSVMVSFSAGEEAVLSLESRKGQRLTLQAESLNVVRFPEDIGFTLRGVPVSIVNAKTKVTVVEHFYWYGNLRAGDGFSFTLPTDGKFTVIVRPNQIFEGELTFKVSRA